MIPTDRRGLPRKAGEPIEPPKPAPEPGFVSKAPSATVGRPIQLADGGFHMDAGTGLEIVPRIVMPPPAVGSFSRRSTCRMRRPRSAVRVGQLELAVRRVGGSAAAEVGVEVPEAYWAAVRNHWLGWPAAGRACGPSRAETGPTHPMGLGGVDGAAGGSTTWIERGGGAGGRRRPTPTVAAVDARLAWLEAPTTRSMSADGKRVASSGTTSTPCRGRRLATGTSTRVARLVPELPEGRALAGDERLLGAERRAAADTLIDTA